MSPKNPYKNRIELLQGTLDMLILQTLQWGPQHGYGIVQALRTQSGEVLQVETGPLPGVAPAGAAGLGAIGVEANREQTARALLPDYRKRQKAIGLRSEPVGADRRGRRRDHARQSRERGSVRFPWSTARRKQDLQEEIDGHLRMAISDRLAGENPRTQHANLQCASLATRL